MCGRITLISPGEAIAAAFGLQAVPPLVPHYNLAPSQPLTAVRTAPDSGAREMVQLRWGLIPYWAEDPRVGERMINARAETAPVRAAFRAAFQTRRCLIPADGFFEWRRGGGTTQPFYVRMRDETPFAIAGLWDRWRGQDGRSIESCTVLTTRPNALLESIHDRMPVILPRQEYEQWLDPAVRKVDRLRGLCTPYPAQSMGTHAVGSWVNDPRNDGPECIAPVPRVQLGLFDS